MNGAPIGGGGMNSPGGGILLMGLEGSGYPGSGVGREEVGSSS
jgi:hypothetical protein